MNIYMNTHEYTRCSLLWVLWENLNLLYLDPVIRVLAWQGMSVELIFDFGNYENNRLFGICPSAYPFAPTCLWVCWSDLDTIRNLYGEMCIIYWGVRF